MKLFDQLAPVFRHRKNASAHRKPSSSSPSSVSTSSSSRIDAAAAPSTLSHERIDRLLRFSVEPEELITSISELPSLRAAYYRFKTLYPKYKETMLADELRREEYPHLGREQRVHLDHCGLGLFSSAQRALDQSSSSFALTEVFSTLATHALYGAAPEGTIEQNLSRQVMDYLKISDSDYCMVFAADHAAAFKLLAESFSFSGNPRLLTVYDHENDSVNAMAESARAKGGRVMTASFKWPSMRVRSTDLRAQLQEKKKKKEIGKGLFVFPAQSKITGAKYSYQWMAMAEKNDWRVLLDASALGPKDMDSLGFSIYRPDFIVCSFYKIFGADNSGFSCLFMKNSSIHCLESNPSHRSIAMVRIVPIAASESARPDADAENDLLEVDEDCASSYGYESEEQIATAGVDHIRASDDHWRRIDNSSSTRFTRSYSLPSAAKIFGSDEAATKNQDIVLSHWSFDSSSPVTSRKSRFAAPIRQQIREEQAENPRQSDGQQRFVRWKDTAMESAERRGIRFHASSSHSNSQSGGVDAIAHRYSSFLCDHSDEALDDPADSSPSSAKFFDTSGDGDSFTAEVELMKTTALGVVYENSLSDQGFHVAGGSAMGGEIEEEIEEEEEESIHKRLGRDDGLIDSRKFDYFPTQSRKSSRFSSIDEAADDRIDADDRIVDAGLFVYRKQGKNASFLERLPSSEGENATFLERLPFESSPTAPHNPKPPPDAPNPTLECRALDHANSLGLTKINARLRALVNWLVQSLSKLHHPGSDNLYPLAQIHGPGVKYDRGAAVAFNLVDAAGALLLPAFVQTLADKNNISLQVGFISNVHIRDTSVHVYGIASPSGESQKRVGFSVLTASLGILSNFEDVYRLWVFLAKFLDPEFVRKQKLLHTSTDSVH